MFFKYFLLLAGLFTGIMAKKENNPPHPYSALWSSVALPVTLWRAHTFRFGDLGLTLLSYCPVLKTCWPSVGRRRR